MKKFFSILLVCMLCISLIPVSSFAAIKDKELVSAVEETFKDGKLIKVTTLKETMKWYPKNKIANLHCFQGGTDLCYEDKLDFKEVFDIKAITKEGGKLVKLGPAGGDPAYFMHMMCDVQKEGVSYGMVDVGTYGLNIVRVREGSSNTEIKKQITSIVRDYYSTKKWTVTVEKYKKGKSSNPTDAAFYMNLFSGFQKKNGFGKYTEKTYLLKIKNKADKKKSGWTFVTVAPTLKRIKAPTITVKNLSKSADIKVSWKKMKNAQKYEVWRKVGKNGKYKKVTTIKKLSYRDKKSKVGKKYYYKVKAINLDNTTINSKFSKTKSIVCK